eukprot:scaffold160910_cov25-Tisochrysis_lutea.AAC.3
MLGVARPRRFANSAWRDCLPSCFRASARLATSVRASDVSAISSSPSGSSRAFLFFLVGRAFSARLACLRFDLAHLTLATPPRRCSFLSECDIPRFEQRGMAAARSRGQLTAGTEE